MKRSKILLILSVTFLMVSSCQKFVDIKKSSSLSVMTTAEDCQLLLDNYSKMNTGYPIDGEVSADDYYINGISYQSIDFNPIPQDEKDIYTWNSTAKRNAASPNWQGPYQVIYNANLVLETIEKLEVNNTDEAKLNVLKGSALFFRAYALWHVAQLYTKPFSSETALNDPGIPIRLSSDINEKSSRGTLKETYDRIVQDLQDASGLLQEKSSIATRPNKVAAYAMLARAYLSMEDYPNAWINANAALQINNQLLDYKTISTVSPLPFPRFNNEVIFHSITFRSPILAQGSAAQNTAKIAPDLVSSYASNDLRGKIFLKANSGTNAGTFRFSGNYEQASIATLFNGLAVDELYLMRAECNARAGKTTEAMTDLNTLLRTRFNSSFTDLNASSAEEALIIILKERRKELLMRGLRWTDLRRLNKDPRFKKDQIRTITTGNAPNQTTVTFELPANDKRYTLLIPKEVIDFSSIEQNIR